MTPEPKPDIHDYIRANRGTYTREAITDVLLQAGHAPDAVEAAWAAVLVADTPAPPALVAPSSPPRRAVLNSWRFWLTASLALVTLAVVPIALATALPDQPIGGIVGLALPVVLIAAALVLLARRRARDVAYGLLAAVTLIAALFAVLVLIGVILLLVVLGICVVALGQRVTP